MSEATPILMHSPHAVAANSVRPSEPLSYGAAKWTALISILPVTGGLILMAAFRLTGYDDLDTPGFLWVAIAFVTTVLTAFFASFNLVRAVFRRPVPHAIARLYAFSLLQTVLAAVAAGYCGPLAFDWYMSPHALLSATNTTRTPIDDLVIHFDNGDIDVGPLQPGETKHLGRPWASVKDALEISVTAKGHTLRKVDCPSADLFHFKQPFKRHPVNIKVEDSELPREAGPSTSRASS